MTPPTADHTRSKTPQTDRSSVGLCCVKESPETELLGLTVMNAKFRIPPGADNHEVKSKHTFRKAAKFLRTQRTAGGSAGTPGRTHGPTR
jgi:hypothetical protein